MVAEKRFEFKDKEALKAQKSYINPTDIANLGHDETLLRVAIHKVFMKMTDGKERYSEEELLHFLDQRQRSQNFNDHMQVVEEDSTRLRDISCAYVIYAGAGYLPGNHANPTDVAVNEMTELFNDLDSKSKTEWVKNKLGTVYQDVNQTLVQAGEKFILSWVGSYASEILRKECSMQEMEKKTAESEAALIQHLKLG